MEPDATIAFFPLLAWAGYYLLWQVPFKDGLFQAMGEIKRRGSFPNGDSLLTTFSGIRVLDKWLQGSVVFYSELLRAPTLSQALILFEAHSNLQATATCMLVLALLRGMTSLHLAGYLAFWGMYSQAWGGAFVFPLWCLAETLINIAYPITTVPMLGSNGQELLLTTLIGLTIPVVFVSPLIFSLGSVTRQRTIAFYRLAPVIFAVSHPLLSTACQSDFMRPLFNALPSVTLEDVLMINAVYTAFFHILAFVLSVLTTKPLITLKLTYAPTNSHIILDSNTVLLYGTHRFLQHALLVMGVTFIVFGCGTIAPSTRDVRLVLWQVIKCVVLGPGAVLSISLVNFIRELTSY